MINSLKEIIKINEQFGILKVEYHSVMKIVNAVQKITVISDPKIFRKQKA